MTEISKYDALALSFYVKTHKQMFAFADAHSISKMEEQAVTMTLSTITIRITLALTPLLVIVTNYCTKPGSMGRHVLSSLSAVNTLAAVYALKQLYNTACYLRTAMNQYPSLRASLLRSS